MYPGFSSPFQGNLSVTTELLAVDFKTRYLCLELAQDVNKNISKGHSTGSTCLFVQMFVLDTAMFFLLNTKHWILNFW